MVQVALQIEPEMCGPVSVGTVSVIKLVARHLELSLGVALELVSRAVYDAQTVLIPAPSLEAAAALCRAFAELPPIPRVRAEIVENRDGFGAVPPGGRC